MPKAANGKWQKHQKVRTNTPTYSQSISLQVGAILTDTWLAHWHGVWRLGSVRVPGSTTGSSRGPSNWRENKAQTSCVTRPHALPPHSSRLESTDEQMHFLCILAVLLSCNCASGTPVPEPMRQSQASACSDPNTLAQLHDSGKWVHKWAFC